MTGTDVRGDASTAAPGTVEARLEVAILNISDADSSKAFYQNLGWRLDADFPINPQFRILQFTPTGSPTSIIFGTGISLPGTVSPSRLMLVVQDINAARADLMARGVDVTEVFHGTAFLPGTAGRIPGPDPEGKSYSSFVSFNDPDGNVWILQEITQRLPGR